MKPEKLIEARYHDLAIRQHRAYQQAINGEDPGIPKGSEGMPFTERGQKAVKFIQSALDPVLTSYDKGKINYGRTPILPIEVSDDNVGWTFYLQLEMNNLSSPRESNIAAVWRDGEQYGFQYTSELKLSDISDDMNSLLGRRLNEIEHSILKYSEAAAGLMADEALELGFSHSFSVYLPKRHNAWEL